MSNQLKVIYPGYDHIEATVRNGFPILFWYSIGKPEPDVGLMYSYIDDSFVTLRSGKPAKWLKITDKEYDELERKVT